MIYLDNNATTRIDPRVREAMLPWLDEGYGNPSGGYRIGRLALEAVDLAREQVAALVGAGPEEIVFTSGGTESINTAIRSALFLRPERKTLVTSTVEHSAVEELVTFHEETGYEGERVPVDLEGRLDLAGWRNALESDDVAVASLIWANNETGVIAPIAEAAKAAAARDIYLHVDSVQAAGKIPIDLTSLPIHAASFSAHKFHGPKGVGALYLDRRSRFRPEFLGGGQESGRRSGTENVAGIVGMGEAAAIALENLDRYHELAELRDRFESGIREALPDVEINGDPSLRIANTTNLYFPGIDGEGLLILLDEAGVCCSPGSACSTGSVQPSRILLAMGHSRSRARSSVRFSLSRFTTREEIDEAIEIVRTAVGKLRIVMPSTGSRVVSSSSRSSSQNSG